MNIGILGLGVMGRSLAQNFERNGYSVAGYDLNLRFDRSLFKDRNIKIVSVIPAQVHVLREGALSDKAISFPDF